MNARTDKVWLIWNADCRGWLLAIGEGFTSDVAAANRYTLAEATEICEAVKKEEDCTCWIDNNSTMIPSDVIVPSPELLAELTKPSRDGFGMRDYANTLLAGPTTITRPAADPDDEHAMDPFDMAEPAALMRLR